MRLRQLCWQLIYYFLDVHYFSYFYSEFFQRYSMEFPLNFMYGLSRWYTDVRPVLPLSLNNRSTTSSKKLFCNNGLYRIENCLILPQPRQFLLLCCINTDKMQVFSGLKCSIRKTVNKLLEHHPSVKSTNL